MNESSEDINLVLISDQESRAFMIQREMHDCGITGVIRRISACQHAIDCGQKTGAYRNKELPDLILYDFSSADPYNTSVLRKIAFGDNKTNVPVILLVSPDSQEKLDGGDIDGGKAVMFSPTSLASFVRKLQPKVRASFLHALRTLYEYGPILVNIPLQELQRDDREYAIQA